MRRETAGATILLAEDEPAIRSLIEAALTAEGYLVLPAKNGYEALTIFNERAAEIDLVITDMCMPYIGGAELIAALQARCPGLRSLCITAYPMDAQLGLPLLPKPFSRKELLQRVRDALVRPTAIAV